jgi:hypothetical protein
MRRAWIVGLLLAGCGLENVFTNAGHDENERPASKIVGNAPQVPEVTRLAVIDGEGTVIEPFQATKTGEAYELRLPSSKYQMLRVRATLGNAELRVVVPGIDEESETTGVDFDARNFTETLIAEARLSADGDSFDKVTPEAYLGTRALIRAAFDQPGPTQELLQMVERMLTRFDAQSGILTPEFFAEPVLTDMFQVTQSPLDLSGLARNPFDYVGDGVARGTSAAFDAKLSEVARLFRPAGCSDPARIRVLFESDFNEGSLDANGNVINRFKWASDKPGKGMFFVGWTYTSAGLEPSGIIDPALDQAMGSATPNTIPMYDDGTNGDRVAGDNIWSVYFDMPRSQPPDRILRIGYKYTWGTQGAPWTGSEEWPGNSRILEIVDDNDPPDDFVYRRDVFGDEASNKDKSNAGPTSTIDWDTLERTGCGFLTHENRDFDPVTRMCLPLPTPDWIGPLTVTCTQ